MVPNVPTVAVAEVTAERAGEDFAEIPHHLAGPPGTIRIQLRSTVHRLAMGVGLARRPELLDRVRALPGLPGLVTSPVGGTFVVGGPDWLGLSAIGMLPPDQPMPLDWMMAGLRDWLDAALRPLGVGIVIGRVERAWCPGFSDVVVDGRKLAGLGFRVTREWVAMRGMLAVRPMDAADAVLLGAAHRLIGLTVHPRTSTSLVECTGDDSWTVGRAIGWLRSVAT